MERTKGPKQVSEARKNAILDSTDVGVRQHVIVKHYSMLQSTLSNIIRRRNDCNNENEEARGRKRRLTDRCIRALRKCIRENRFKPLRVITAKFNGFRPVSVSISTVWRVLTKKKIKDYVAVCKPYLTRNHRKRRMQ